MQDAGGGYRLDQAAAAVDAEPGYHRRVLPEQRRRAGLTRPADPKALHAGSTTISGAKIEGSNIKADDLQVVITGQSGGIEPILYKWETLRDRVTASPGNASFGLSATTPAGR